MYAWISAALVFLIANAAGAMTFQFISTRALRVADISADGSTVVYASINSGGGGSVDLVDVETGQQSFVTGIGDRFFNPAISGDGSIVQGARNLGGGPQSLFEYANGTLNEIGLTTRAPRALSDDGTISAGFEGIEGPVNGVMATRTTGGVNGTTELLGDLPGGLTSSIAWDLSGDGGIVIGQGSSAQGTEAFRWEAGTMSGLGDLPGGGFGSVAYGISQDGTTIVGAGTSATNTEAFRWRNGMMTSLGSLSGGSGFSESQAVSADGSVVVGNSVNSSNTSAAFVWDSAHGMREVSVLLAALGVDLDALGIELFGALGVSADGRTIVGIGYQGIFLDPEFGFPDLGVEELIWIATVPEPTVGVLLGLGLAGLGWRRGRIR